MEIALIIVLVALLGGFAVLLLMDGSVQVGEKMTMKVTARKVFDKVRDLETWKEWSPWLMHDPDAKLVFSERAAEEGGNYSWDSPMIGAGNLTNVKLKEGESVEQDLNFIRPFKSKSKVFWRFAEKDGHTEVRWK